MDALKSEIRRCTLCRDRFAATKSAHQPRPVVWFSKSAKVLIAGQAPGLRVHTSGKPFTDPSGDRLRDWMGVSKEVFYDTTKIAIVPMAFCFPGYSAKGADLPPPSLCRATWRDRVMAELQNIRLTLVIGKYAMKYHLDDSLPVTDAVAGWRERGKDLFVLPHPSWRNTAWLKKNPWFSAEVLPRLKSRVKDVLND